MTWQTIDTAPKDGTYVIGYFPTCGQPIRVARYIREERFVNGQRTYTSDHWVVEPSPGVGFFPKPTHWMPIPPTPPTTSQELESIWRNQL